MNERPSSSTGSMLDTVRDRCRAMLLPSWRCDTAGSLVTEPIEPGLAGLWLRSSQITALVEAAAKEWMGQTAPTPRQIFDGCWLIPIIHELRRRRTGITLAMAAMPAMLSAPAFLEACTSAGLDEHATRLIMRKLAVFDEAGVKRTASTLQWMVNDLAALSEHSDAVQGFTHELTQSYETIDLLYSLGRSMQDLDRPEKFVNLVCERLHQTLPFGWLACQFTQDVKLNGLLSGRLVSRGPLPADAGPIRDALSRLSKKPAGELRGFLTPGGSDDDFGDARVLVQPITLDGKLAGIMLCGDKHGEDPQVSSYDIQLIEAAAGYTGAFLANLRLINDQQATFMGTLRALTAAIDAKDRYTCGHSERVAHLATQLAIATGMDPAGAERIRIGGLVHDVGKIGVPEQVLCKPGRLNDEEFALIKMHPETGYRILKDIPMLADVLPGVLYHHERYDGKGYPHGLKGRDIPLAGRLLAIADTFDAMSSNRAYRPGVSRDRVLNEIATCAGTQFDPDLAAAFVKLDLRSYDEMVARHAGEYGSQRIVAVAA